METFRPEYRYLGLAHAGAVIAAWGFGLWLTVFQLDWTSTGAVWNFPATLLMTVLFTGLFITAHDGMHGLITPHNSKVNNFIGSFAVFLYAGFSYQRLLIEHHKHHATPAAQGDPDFHDGKNRNLFAWFFRFLWHYRTIRPFLFFGVVHAIVVHGLGLPWQAFAFGWAGPALLSSFQLFYFGTYLPHREREGGYNDQRAFSNEYPTWLSLLTCFHFGYHYEHHKAPFVPWWKLPQARRFFRGVKK